MSILTQYFLLLSLSAFFLISCNEQQANITTETSNSQEQKDTTDISTINNHTFVTESKVGEEKDVIVRYEFEESKNDHFLLPLYENNSTKGDFRMTNVVDEFVKIEKGTPMIKVAKIIAAHVSKKMGGLRLGVDIEDIGDGVLCLNLELIEPKTADEFFEHSWAQSFSASGGANQVLCIIVSNFLQKNYKGPWIDLIRFEDEGDSITKHEYVRYKKEGYQLK